MNRDKLKEELTRDEDDVPYAYQDSLGYWTIGIGHLIDKRKGGKLSDAARQFIFNEDVDEAVADLDKALPWWRDMTDARQRVLVNMRFNLGLAGLLGFKNTLAMMQKGDYEGAAKGMLNSKWATQVGARATRLSKMMREG